MDNQDAECTSSSGLGTGPAWSDPAAGYVVCNLRDVTERHQDREQLVKPTEQLQTALTTRVVIERAKGIIATATD